jgi:hypothetical protein
MECSRISPDSAREGDSIMTDKREKLEKLEKLESCVMQYWDTLSEDMQADIRKILDEEVQ